MKRHFIILSCAFLSGCTNMMNFKPTMASDPPLLGVEGIALATELSRAYVKLTEQDKGICDKLKLGYQERRSTHVSKYKMDKNGIIKDFQCIGFREVDEGGENVKLHVRSGLALSDYFCTNFFDRISEHSGKRRFARNTTNDVGTMVSTVLGLASAGSGLTGGVGAGFGLLDSSWRNYDENFLVSADLPTLRRLVLSEQAKFRDTLVMPDNYPDATNVILRYADLCSFVGMKGLLVESMEGKTTENNLSRDDLVTKRAEDFVKAYEAAQAKKQTETSAVQSQTP